MTGDVPSGATVRRRRAVPALVAVALSVSVVLGVLASGVLEGDPPVPSSPPPTVDTEGAYVVARPAVVRVGEGTVVDLVVVNPGPQDFPYGMSGRVHRWDGERWVDEQMFLGNDMPDGGPGAVHDLDEDVVVPAVLRGAPAGSRAPALTVDVDGLSPGWYRFGVGAAAQPPLDPDGGSPPPPPADTPGAAFALLEVRAS